MTTRTEQAKEEVDRARQALEVCRNCGGSGELDVQYSVTADMASDAGEPSMEGMPITQSERCEECFGAGYIPDDCVDVLIAAVLADQDAQTRQAFEAGWFADRRWNHETEAAGLWTFTAEHSSVGGTDETIAEAYAAYLATPPAQKGTK